jgi:hypothetical protein
LLDHPAAARTHSTAFGSPAPAAPLQGRSQWERIQLDDGIELHVRRPLTRHQQRLLDKLLAEVRRIFEEPDA